MTLMDAIGLVADRNGAVRSGRWLTPLKPGRCSRDPWIQIVSQIRQQQPSEWAGLVQAWKARFLPASDVSPDGRPLHIDPMLCEDLAAAFAASGKGT